MKAQSSSSDHLYLLQNSSGIIRGIPRPPVPLPILRKSSKTGLGKMVNTGETPEKPPPPLFFLPPLSSPPPPALIHVETVRLPLIPLGIISRMSCMTAARNSKSKCDSTRCLVIVLSVISNALSQYRISYDAVPFEFLPSNCLANKFPSHLSSRGTIPRMKKSQTRHPGAQKPTPGPFPTGPVLNLSSAQFLHYWVGI